MNTISAAGSWAAKRRNEWLPSQLQAAPISAISEDLVQHDSSSVVPLMDAYEEKKKRPQDRSESSLVAGHSPLPSASLISRPLPFPLGLCDEDGDDASAAVSVLHRNMVTDSPAKRLSVEPVMPTYQQVQTWSALSQKDLFENSPAEDRQEDEDMFKWSPVNRSRKKLLFDKNFNAEEASSPHGMEQWRQVPAGLWLDPALLLPLSHPSRSLSRWNVISVGEHRYRT